MLEDVRCENLWNTVNSWPLFIPGYSLSPRLFVLIRQSWKVNNEHMQMKAFTMPGWIVWLSWKKCGRLYTDTAPPGEKNILTTKWLPHTLGQTHKSFSSGSLPVFQFMAAGFIVGFSIDCKSSKICISSTTSNVLTWFAVGRLTQVYLIPWCCGRLTPLNSHGHESFHLNPESLWIRPATTKQWIRWITVTKLGANKSLKQHLMSLNIY